MATYQKIEYRIGTDGTVTETVLNGDGQTCLLATAELERSLGTVASRELLPEYSDPTTDELIDIDASQTLYQG